MDETAGEVAILPQIADPNQTLLHGYLPLLAGGPDDPAYDEAIEADGSVRPEYAKVLTDAAAQGAEALRQLQFGDRARTEHRGHDVPGQRGGARPTVPDGHRAAHRHRRRLGGAVPGPGATGPALDLFVADVYGDRGGRP